jgi:hypothetical protein
MADDPQQDGERSSRRLPSLENFFGVEPIRLGIVNRRRIVG